MGVGRLSRGSGDRCQSAGAGLCAFLILLENRTKPRNRRMRSLTMAVPTEKAAVRQAMPRGRRRRGRGCGRRGRAAGKRLRSPQARRLRPTRAPAPAPAPVAAGAPAPPTTRPRRTRPRPAIGRRAGAGRSRQVRVLLFCSCAARLPQFQAVRLLPLPAPLAWQVPRVRPGPGGAEFGNSRGLGQRPRAPCGQSAGVPLQDCHLKACSAGPAGGQGRRLAGEGGGAHFSLLGISLPRRSVRTKGEMAAPTPPPPPLQLHIWGGTPILRQRTHSLMQHCCVPDAEPSAG